MCVLFFCNITLHIVNVGMRSIHVLWRFSVSTEHVDIPRSHISLKKLPKLCFLFPSMHALWHIFVHSYLLTYHFARELFQPWSLDKGKRSLPILEPNAGFIGDLTQFFLGWVQYDVSILAILLTKNSDLLMNERDTLWTEYFDKRIRCWIIYISIMN